MVYTKHILIDDFKFLKLKCIISARSKENGQNRSNEYAYQELFDSTRLPIYVNFNTGKRFSSTAKESVKEEASFLDGSYSYLFLFVLVQS